MRRWLTPVVTGVLIAALPALAQAAFLWSLSVVPSTATEGQATTFTFTATNNDVVGKIGCVQVDLPGSFTIISIGSPVASNPNDTWNSFPAGGNKVIARSEDGGGRLQDGESVTFTVTATPTTAGVKSLNNHVHSSENCGGTAFFGAPLSITITPSGVPTPTPSSTPVATPVATPRPTARPTPIPTSKPTPTMTPTPTPTPTATPNASASQRAATPAPVPSPSSSSGPPAIRVAPYGDGSQGAPTDLGVAVDVLGLINSPLGWFVPGALVGGPGLLVILFVVLQAVGALAWIPAVRRMGDEDDDQRRKRRAGGVSRGA